MVDGQDVGRGQDAHVRRHHGLRGHTLAVAGDGHVAHHVNIGHLLAEMVDRRLGGLGHPFHEFLLRDIPLVVGTGGGVDPALADATVGATDADVLV